MSWPTRNSRIFKPKICNFSRLITTLAPVSRLPPEILCEIFAFVKEKKRDRDVYTEEYPVRWIRVTHVCRHWRDVAFGSPSLWASGPWPLKHIPWIKQMLARSKESRLSIKVNLFDVLQDFLLGFKLVLEYSHRIETISIRFDPADWKKLRRLLPKYTPQLEHLVLECFDGNKPSRLKIFGPEEALNQSPMLRHLSLTGFHIDWNAPSFLRLPALTYLELHFNSPPTWQQLTNAMKALPNLQVLHLDDSLPFHAHKSKSSFSRPIHFSFLRDLIISDTSKNIEIFLRCVSFTPATFLKIDCCDYKGDSKAYLNHLSSLVLRLCKMILPNARLQSLVMSQNCFVEDLIRVALFRQMVDDDQILADSMPIAPCLELTCSRGEYATSNDGILAKTMKIIFDSQLVQNVSRVYLPNISASLEPAALANTIGKLHQVHSVVTTRAASSALIGAMRLGSYIIEDAAETEGPATSLYFPNLSSICLHKTRFRPSDRSRRTSKSPPFFQLLNDCLVERCELGAKIDKITLRLCRNVSKHDVFLLEKNATEVEWDHHELASSFDCESSSDFSLSTSGEGSEEDEDKGDDDNDDEEDSEDDADSDGDENGE